MTSDSSVPAPPPSDCLFCKIVSGAIPAAIAYQDEHCIAFEDIHPAAPVHLLVVPRRHLENVTNCTPSDEQLLGHLHLIAAQLAQQYGVDADGYRLVTNNGARAGQSIWHLHVHLLGGRVMTWPPG